MRDDGHVLRKSSDFGKVKIFLVFDGFFYYNLTNCKSLGGADRRAIHVLLYASHRYLTKASDFPKGEGVFEQPSEKWRAMMRKLFVCLTMGSLLLGAAENVFADGAVIRVQGKLVLIDTDKGVGGIGDVQPVYRLTAGGWQKIGEVQIVKFAKGKAAGRIVQQKGGSPIAVNDIVKVEAPASPATPGTQAAVSTTPVAIPGSHSLALGIALPYNQIGGDFDGTRIARESGSILTEAPYYVPKLTKNVGVMGWVALGFPENVRPLSALRIGYLYSQHKGTWQDPEEIFRRRYLDVQDEGSVEGITVHYHKISVNAMFDLYKTNRFKLMPTLGVDWEIMRLKNVTIDYIVTDPYSAEEMSPLATAVLGPEKTQNTYYGSSPNRWLYNYVMGVDIGLDAAYYFSYELALDVGLRYNIYSNILPLDGKVYSEDGSTAESLKTNAFSVFFGFSYALDLYRLMK
jgi:hypothetical protein